MSMMEQGMQGMQGAPGDDPLAALLGGVGAGQAVDAAPSEGEDTLEILRRMIEDAKLYIDTDEDEEDKLTMTKILQQLQSYLADEQREQQDALQGKVSPRLLARTYGG